MIKPWPLLPAVAGGFTAGDFAVDAAARTVTCPAGITRHLTAKNAVIFGAACRDCPLRQRCTTAKDGRTVHLHEHDGLLRAARAAWAARAGLREDYIAHRPDVERAIAQVATWRGRRIKLRYRGEAKNNAWAKRRTAAVNLRGLLARGWPAKTAPGAWPPDQAAKSPATISPARRPGQAATAVGQPRPAAGPSGQARPDGNVSTRHDAPRSAYFSRFLVEHC